MKAFLLLLAIMFVPTVAASPNLLAGDFFHPGTTVFHNDDTNSGDAYHTVCYAGCTASTAGTTTDYACQNALDNDDATGCSLSLQPSSGAPSGEMASLYPQCVAIYDNNPSVTASAGGDFTDAYYLDFDGTNFGSGKEANWVKIDFTLAPNSTTSLDRLCFALDVYDSNLNSFHVASVTGFSAGHNQRIMQIPHGFYVVAGWRIIYNSTSATPSAIAHVALSLNTVGLYLDMPDAAPPAIVRDTCIFCLNFMQVLQSAANPVLAVGIVTTVAIGVGQWVISKGQ